MVDRKRASGALEDIRIPTKVKLSALWAATMFCYLYGDYFGLYQPGAIRGMLEGRMAPLGPVTQGILLAVALMMAIPSVLVVLTLALPPRASRWVNIGAGLAYTAIVLLTTPGAWLYYLFLSAMEVVLTLLIVQQAWTWPREALASAQT